jgi:hypothetical protein
MRIINTEPIDNDIMLNISPKSHGKWKKPVVKSEGRSDEDKIFLEGIADVFAEAIEEIFSVKFPEKGKALEKIIKRESKLYEYKVYMAIPYKIINGFLFKVIIETDKKVSVKIDCKPIILDKMCWEITGLTKNIKGSLDKYHVNGFNAADIVTINEFSANYTRPEEAKEVYNRIMVRANRAIKKYSKEVYDLETFHRTIKSNPKQDLNNILIEIIKNNYSRAMKKINKSIKEGKYIRTTDQTLEGKSIIEWAKEYCLGRL